MKQTIILLALAFTFASCKTVSPSKDKNVVELSGLIQKAGISTYQYGTHTLQSDSKTYALKSSTLDLNGYSNKKVTIKGTKVEGYPLENGPDFIEVSSVSPAP